MAAMLMCKAYLAGPMRFYPAYNFALFDLARDELEAVGWDVVSPADLDRADGFDPILNPQVPCLDYEACMARDAEHIKTCGSMIFLPGWEVSAGAKREKQQAVDLGLDLYRIRWEGQEMFVEPLLPLSEQAAKEEVEAKLDNPEESVCLTAYNLVRGARRGAYGHPLDDYARTGRIWGAILGIPDIPPRIACLMMQAPKISREVNAHKRDNCVDGPGYWDCVQLIVEEENRRLQEKG